MDYPQLFEPEEYPAAQQPSHDESQDADAQDLVEAAAAHTERGLVTAPDDHPARPISMHSLEKAHIASRYAQMVGTGMKNVFRGRLAWVELYAGPGILRLRESGTFVDGSPVASLKIRDRFNTYVFVDLDPKCTGAMRARIGHEPGVHILDGNANDANVHDEIAQLVPRDGLLVLYADPAELNFSFTTIEYFTKRYAHLDLLLNFPAPGLVRALRAGHAQKAGDVLNSDDPLGLIGPLSGRPGLSIRDYFQRQLAAIGYEHFESESIRLHRKRTPIYDLMIASHDPKAKFFFDEARRIGREGQYRMQLF